MRRAGRSLSPALQRETPAQAGQRRALQGLVDRHRRQQAGKALGQHGLARAWWAHHEQTVSARCSDLKRPFGGCLALDVGKVCVAGLRWQWRSGDAGPAVGGLRRRRIGRLVRRHRQKLLHDVKQMPGPVNLRAGHQRCLFGTARWQHQFRGHLCRMQGQAHGQRTAHWPELAGQRQLPRELMAGQRRRIDLPAGRQDAQRNRQVKPARVLGQISRR